MKSSSICRNLVDTSVSILRRMQLFLINTLSLSTTTEQQQNNKNIDMSSSISRNLVVTSVSILRTAQTTIVSYQQSIVINKNRAIQKF